MGEYLATLGLNSLTLLLSGSLRIYFYGRSTPVIARPFLPNITYVFNDLQVQDLTPAGSVRLSSLPSLQNVQFAANLVVNNTGFTDMTSFQNYRCTAYSTTITNNAVLSTLVGLNNMEVSGFVPKGSGVVQPDSYVAFIANNNPRLKSVGWTSIFTVAGCPGTLSRPPPYFQTPVTSIDVQVAGCKGQFTKYAQLCDIPQVCPDR